MTTSETLAIAAHLHVLLRRKTGRVTDTEWMAQNVEYAAAIVRFACARAAQDNHPELAEWAGKLEQAVLPPGVRARHLPADTSSQALRGRPSTPPETVPVSEFPADTGFPESSLDAPRSPKGPAVPRYVGGIR